MTTLWSAVAVAALMLVTWAVSLRRRDVSIVDVVWGPAFVLVALVSALTGDAGSQVRWLLLGLTAAWGLRLGVHLAVRKHREPDETAATPSCVRGAPRPFRGGRW